MGDVMDLAARLSELQKRVEQHKEVLLTEEAAKTALVMPFIQALGYDVFNPSEVVPEFTADVGTKKGEKVDYAIIADGKVSILIECKPASVQLDVNHASQLFRYFSCTDARLAVLTNGVIYDFYSDVDRPNKMDDRPFFSFNLGAIKPMDLKTLESFGKATFDIGHIVQEAGNLKIQNLLRKELAKEFAQPSDEFIKLFAARVHTGNITQVIKERFSKLVLDAVNGFVRELVNDRLSQAIKASAPVDEQQEPPQSAADQITTTDEEIAGFRIIQAIASRVVDPKRVFMRDQQSYCGILLDDNNRKPIGRLHFNNTSRLSLGTFSGKEETKAQISDLTDIYKFEEQILARLKEFA
jgi:hypothetical protein